MIRNNTLVIYDVDDTLFTANQDIHIRDASGELVEVVVGQHYKQYMNNRKVLPEGHYLCFESLMDGREFYRTKKPIDQVLHQLQRDIEACKQHPSVTVIVLTARGEMDYLEDYLQAFRDHNVDIDHTGVVFVGDRDSKSEKGKTPSAELKRLAFESFLQTNKYDHVIVYDDDDRNLKMFINSARDFSVSIDPFIVENEQIHPFFDY